MSDFCTCFLFADGNFCYELCGTIVEKADKNVSSLVLIISLIHNFYLRCLNRSVLVNLLR